MCGRIALLLAVLLLLLPVQVLAGFGADPQPDRGPGSIALAAPRYDPPPDDVCEGANVLQRCTSGHLEGDLTLYHDDYDSPT